MTSQIRARRGDGQGDRGRLLRYRVVISPLPSWQTFEPQAGKNCRVIMVNKTFLPARGQAAPLRKSL
jgi:hypothetical protein